MSYFLAPPSTPFSPLKQSGRKRRCIHCGLSPAKMSSQAPLQRGGRAVSPSPPAQPWDTCPFWMVWLCRARRVSSMAMRCGIPTRQCAELHMASAPHAHQPASWSYCKPEHINQTGHYHRNTPNELSVIGNTSLGASKYCW